MGKSVNSQRSAINSRTVGQWIVLWDFPTAAKSHLAQFYRRLDELLQDFGGKAHCRATKSAYIVSGEDARACAYALGALAARYGTGYVGEENGVVVLPLGDVTPQVHFDALRRADEVVDALCVDRRRKENKRAPRGLAWINHREDRGHREKKDADAEGAWVNVDDLRRRVRVGTAA